MAVTDIYSKRETRLRGAPEVFAYDEVPEDLRVQVYFAISRVWPDWQRKVDFFKLIELKLTAEYGMLELTGERDAEASVRSFLLEKASAMQALDVTELSLRLIETNVQLFARGIQVTQQVVDEVNQRFAEKAIGYRYERGSLIRIDSEFIHTEVIKPALKLTSAKGFEHVDTEFRQAHEHLRHGRTSESMASALKALESTLKTLCATQGWPHDEHATARRLFDICFENGLIPDYMQSKFSGLRTTLESGVPTLRNRESGHGRAPSQPIAPPAPHLAQYAVNLTAAAIIFLIQCQRGNP